MAVSGTPLPPPRTHRGLAPARCGICSAGCPAFGRRGACETTAAGVAGLEPHRRTSILRIRLARGLARRRRPAGRRTHRSDARYVRPRRHAAGTAPCGHRPRTWLFRSARPGQAGLGYDVARTLAGRDAYRSGPDPLLWWSPWALSALAVLLVLGAATWARLTRLGGRIRRHTRAWAWGFSVASALLGERRLVRAPRARTRSSATHDLVAGSVVGHNRPVLRGRPRSARRDGERDQASWGGNSKPRRAFSSTSVRAG